MCCQWEQVQEKKKRGREMQDVLDKGKYKWKRMGIREEVADGNCSDKVRRNMLWGCGGNSGGITVVGRFQTNYRPRNSDFC